MKAKSTSGNDLSKHSETATVIPPEDRHRMISEAAYYLAESQGFCGDCDVQNWLDAEVQINRNFASHGPCL